MVIALTEKAAGEVRRKMEAAKVEPDMFLRVGIKAGGCSGYDYNFFFAKDLLLNFLVASSSVTAR